MSNHHRTFYDPSKSPMVYLIILWVVLTAFNINKAFHIDDAFHLEAAENIRLHPWKPMSSWINWEDSPTLMFNGNNPPFFFYLINFYQLLFGHSEVSLHLFLSVFTFLSLFYFYQLGQLLQVKSPLTMLSIFAFCPAFVVNQNVMLDIPILAISLGIMYYLLKGQKHDKFSYYIISAILLSFGIFIKYSLIPLFFVILWTIFITKNYQKSIVLIIPIILFLLWSLWNYIEFGQTHIYKILTKPKPEVQINILVSLRAKTVGFLGTLGSITTFTVIFIYSLIPKKEIRLLTLLACLFLVISIPLVYFKQIEETIFNRLLNIIFILNGLILIGLLTFQSISSWLAKKNEYLKSQEFVILIYVTSVSAFLILIAPFNATRHTLLIIPFIILLGHKHFDYTKRILHKYVIAATVILATLLGISDWLIADFYRKNAQKIHLKNATVWSIGHWGWQWYSKQAGMLIYAKNADFNVRNEDYVVFPQHVHKQTLSKEIGLDTIKIITEPSTIFTFFSGINKGTMYSSSHKIPAWSLSNSPIDTIFVCRVNKELGMEVAETRIRSDKDLFNEIKYQSKTKNLPLDSLIKREARKYIEQQRNKKHYFN
ncbi:ArnT family glycosyltransferase [Aquirufa sp. ROCK2-A2]